MPSCILAELWANCRKFKAVKVTKILSARTIRLAVYKTAFIPVHLTIQFNCDPRINEIYGLLSCAIAGAHASIS